MASTLTATKTVMVSVGPVFGSGSVCLLGACVVGVLTTVVPASESSTTDVCVLFIFWGLVGGWGELGWAGCTIEPTAGEDFVVLGVTAMGLGLLSSVKRRYMERPPKNNPTATSNVVTKVANAKSQAIPTRSRRSA